MQVMKLLLLSMMDPLSFESLFLITCANKMFAIYLSRIQHFGLDAFLNKVFKTK